MTVYKSFSMAITRPSACASCSIAKVVPAGGPATAILPPVDAGADGGPWPTSTAANLRAVLPATHLSPQQSAPPPRTSRPPAATSACTTLIVPSALDHVRPPPRRREVADSQAATIPACPAAGPCRTAGRARAAPRRRHLRTEAARPPPTMSPGCAALASPRRIAPGRRRAGPAPPRPGSQAPKDQHF